MRLKNQALVPLYPEGKIHYDGRIFKEVEKAQGIFISKAYLGVIPAERMKDPLGCATFKYKKLGGCP